MNNIWFTSDTHYGHKNIVRGTTEWSSFDPNSSHQGVRDFDTLEEHNEALVKSINGLVKENDTLYHLGDWSFGGIANIWEFRKRLRCKNIHLILGNHDEHIEANKVLPNCRYRKDSEHIVELPSTVGRSFIQGRSQWVIDGEPPMPGIPTRILLKGTVQAQDLFSSVQHYKKISLKIPCTKAGKYGKTTIIMSHYAMRVWDKSHHGSIMLYGHSHGTLDEMTPNIANPTWIGDNYYIRNYRTMDVGVDTHNLYPYHLDEIIDIMKGRDITMEVDHHNSTTN